MPEHRATSGAGLSGQDWPAAVIAGAYQTGVLGARSLQRRGVRAVMFDSAHTNPGFRSVYGPARLCPDPDTQPEQWLKFMIALAQELGGKPVLIASSDKFVTAIALHEKELSSHFRLSPGAALQGEMADKQTQYHLSATHGMPMPATRLIESAEDLADFASGASFPCLLKPTHFREWQKFAHDHPLYDTKVAIAANATELLERYRQASSITPKVLAQEIIQGPDTAKRVYLAYYDRSGRRIAHAMFRELRCTPIGFGPASVSEPVEDDDTDAVCDGFLQRLGYRGICEIEMKRDSRDGRVKLIEANPRLSGGGDAAPYAGVDLCWIHYQDLAGLDVSPVSPVKARFQHIVLRSDAEAMVTYRKRGMISWADIARSYKPPLAFYDLDWKDWKYSLETLYVFASQAVRTVLREYFGQRRRQ